MHYLASQPCIACLRLHGITTHPVQLHHVHVWGLPRRTNNPLRDATVIPLCHAHHQSGRDAVHVVGEPAFFTRMQTTPDALLLTQITAYCAAAWLPLPPGMGARQAAEWVVGREK